MGESIISVIKVVDTEESFVSGPQRSRRQQGRGKGIERRQRVGTGEGAVDPTERGMRISAS